MTYQGNRRQLGSFAFAVFGLGWWDTRAVIKSSPSSTWTGVVYLVYKCLHCDPECVPIKFWITDQQSSSFDRIEKMRADDQMYDMHYAHCGTEIATIGQYTQNQTTAENAEQCARIGSEDSWKCDIDLVYDETNATKRMLYSQPRGSKRILEKIIDLPRKIETTTSVSRWPISIALLASFSYNRVIEPIQEICRTSLFDYNLLPRFFLQLLKVDRFLRVLIKSRTKLYWHYVSR